MLTPTAIDLIHEMEQMQIIDCHEHLPSEKERVAMPTDVFTLFSHYNASDIATAGMPSADYARLFDRDVDLDERWRLFKPYFEQIRFGSYARAAFIAAKEFYGCDDINDDTYRELSERIAAFNTPGIYKRVLRDRCKIRYCLNQGSTTAEEADQFGNQPWVTRVTEPQSYEHYTMICTAHHKRPRSLDGYVGLMRTAVEEWKAEGAVGVKIPRTWPWPLPDKKKAAASFKKILEKKKRSPEQHYDLEGYLTDQMLDIARDFDLPVAVHTGVWGDFPKIDAKNFIPWIINHPDTKIDLYHLSIPSVRDAVVIGKNFPNVWLNLCWAHLVSQKMTISAMDEMLDMVPVNKVFGFGGDYATPVEKTLGHLMMAREDIAIVLGNRIDAGLMNRDEALRVAHQWLWDNPKEVYKLDL